MVAIKEIYLWTTKVRPSWRSPSANTIAYYPLTSSSQWNDMKWFWTAYNLTWGSYWTNQWVDCVNYSSSKPTRSTNILWAAPSAFTVSCWAYVTSWDILAFGWDGGNTFTFFKNGNYFYLWGWNYDYATTWSLTTWWHHLLCSYTPWTSKAYMDWVLVSTASFT